MPGSHSSVIRSFEAVYSVLGPVERITALTVDCGQCGVTSSAGGSALMHLPGGALFLCQSCGSHHAVSHARVAAIETDGDIARHMTGRSPATSRPPCRVAA